MVVALQRGSIVDAVRLLADIRRCGVASAVQAAFFSKGEFVRWWYGISVRWKCRKRYILAVRDPRLRL
jgi:hypothetical protein